MTNENYEVLVIVVALLLGLVLFDSTVYGESGKEEE